MRGKSTKNHGEDTMSASRRINPRFAIGAAIGRERKERGISREEFVRKVKVDRIDADLLEEIEKGEENLEIASWRFIIKSAEVLGMSLEELLISARPAEISMERFLLELFCDEIRERHE
ncbi:MAG: hypothetical protein PHV93_02140 [Candidatus Pacebacteria bacterium]|nr:hypothetical protein [Candidatus Paceibacterota bacterium]